MALTWSIGGMGVHVLESGSYFSPLSRTVLLPSHPPMTNRKPSNRAKARYLGALPGHAEG